MYVKRPLTAEQKREAALIGWETRRRHPRTQREIAALNRGGRASRKLSDDQVRDVRARLDAGETQKSIAARYDLPQACVSFIKTGKTYRDVV